MAAALLIGATAVAQQTFPSSISVTGKAEREVTPDEIFVSIFIEETTSKGKITVAEQERKMIDALKKLGIDVEKNLTVSDIEGDLQAYLLRRNRTDVSKTYSLKVSDAATLSKVFGALADLNISQASVTKASISNTDAVRAELRVEAMKNAQDAARTLAEAIGQNVGKAFQINEYNFSEPIMYAAAERNVVAYGISSKAADMAPAATLDFKSIKVTHTVSVQFVLE